MCTHWLLVIVSHTSKAFWLELPNITCQLRCAALGVLSLSRPSREGSIMSSLPPFMTGILLSGLGYVYLSRKLVTPRNRLMLEHFPSDGLEPYRPERHNVSTTTLIFTWAIGFWVSRATRAAVITHHRHFVIFSTHHKPIRRKALPALSSTSKTTRELFDDRARTQVLRLY